MANARKIAVKALMKMDSDDAYSNIVINNALNNSELTGVDRAFCSVLFYGTLERRITLDHILSKYCKQPLAEMNNAIVNILRCGIYQLKYMDKVPDSAAVNESVKLAKVLRRHSNSSNFVNAVLRAFIRDNKEIELPIDEIKRISVLYSLPEWIINSLINDYGKENCKKIAEAFLSQRHISVRTNTLKTSTKKLLDMFVENGISAHESDICADSIVIEKGGSVENLPGFSEGLFHVQDISSSLCAKALDAEKDMRVIDVCAAPGGKSFTVAEIMHNTGEVYALDLYEQKVGLIRRSAERLGIKNLTSVVCNAKKPNDNFGEFDRVLCDLPCSGTGILGKKPEIRYKNVALLDTLSDLQYDLLVKSSSYLKVGGILVYSTCSLRKCENRDIAEKFLSENQNFEPYSIFSSIERGINEPDNMLTLLPHIHNTDGFFISAFIRTR